MTSQPSRTTTLRRRCAAALLALTTGLVPVVLGGAALAGTKPPVDLDGEVDAHGTGKIKGSAVEITADDFYFEDTFLKGKANKTVGVTVKNEGAVAHTFTIDAQDIDETLQPGDSTDLDVKVPANGKVANFYCRFHVSQGMQGAVFSKKGTSSAGSGSGGGGGRYDDSGDSGGGYGY